MLANTPRAAPQTSMAIPVNAWLSGYSSQHWPLRFNAALAWGQTPAFRSISWKHRRILPHCTNGLYRSTVWLGLLLEPLGFHPTVLSRPPLRSTHPTGTGRAGAFSSVGKLGLKMPIYSLLQPFSCRSRHPSGSPSDWTRQARRCPPPRILAF